MELSQQGGCVEDEVFILVSGLILHGLGAWLAKSWFSGLKNPGGPTLTAGLLDNQNPG